MPTKLDDEIQRLNMIVPTAWVKKVDDWRRKEPDLPKPLALHAPVRGVEANDACLLIACLRAHWASWRAVPVILSNAVSLVHPRYAGGYRSSVRKRCQYRPDTARAVDIFRL